MARGRENAAIEEAAHAVAALHFCKKVLSLSIDGWGGGEAKWDDFPAYPQDEVLISDAGFIAVQMLGDDPEAEPSRVDMECANRSMMQMGVITHKQRQEMLNRARIFVFEHRAEILFLKKLLYPGGIVSEHKLTLAVHELCSPLALFRPLYDIEAARKLEETLKADRQQWNKEIAMKKHPRLYSEIERRGLQSSEAKQLSAGRAARLTPARGFQRVECLIS
ncbi:MAG: hypothetical protein IAF94_27035 [Pirellulaceae bacterium]|nr:hypothetical protein [Pirellulaceae bacterium]